MFFNKKKKQAAALAEQQNVLNNVQKRLDSAMREPNAVVKLYELEKLKEYIRISLAKSEADAEYSLVKRALWGASSGFVITAGALALTLTPAYPLAVLFIPAAFGAEVGMHRHAEAFKNGKLEEMRDYRTSLKQRMNLACELSDKVLHENLEDIAASSSRGFIFEQFPDVQKRFSEAAARKIVDQGASPKIVLDKKKPDLN